MPPIGSSLRSNKEVPSRKMGVDLLHVKRLDLISRCHFCTTYAPQSGSYVYANRCDPSIQPRNTERFASSARSRRLEKSLFIAFVHIAIRRCPQRGDIPILRSRSASIVFGHREHFLDRLSSNGKTGGRHRLSFNLSRLNGRPRPRSGVLTGVRHIDRALRHRYDTTLLLYKKLQMILTHTQQRRG